MAILVAVFCHFLLSPNSGVSSYTVVSEGNNCMLPTTDSSGTTYSCDHRRYFINTTFYILPKELFRVVQIFRCHSSSTVPPFSGFRGNTRFFKARNIVRAKLLQNKNIPLSFKGSELRFSG